MAKPTVLAHCSMPLSNAILLGSREMASLPLVSTIWRKSCFLLPYPAAQAGRGLSGGRYYLSVMTLGSQPSVFVCSLSSRDREAMIFGGGSLQCRAMCGWLRSTGNIGGSVEGNTSPLLYGVFQYEDWQVWLPISCPVSGVCNMEASGEH